MANRKYSSVVQAKAARRECNRVAQKKYRERLKVKKLASQASPSDGTIRDDTEEEVPSAVGPPSAIVQEASCEQGDVQDERSGPDPPSTALTPLERVASVEQAIDKLLVGVEDPCVKESLKDPIARIEPKFRDLVSRVHQSQQFAEQQEAPVVPSIHTNPHASAKDWSKPCNIPADTIRSLSEQVYRYRAKHIYLTEIELMRAQLDRVLKPVV